MSPIYGSRAKLRMSCLISKGSLSQCDRIPIEIKISSIIIFKFIYVETGRFKEQDAPYIMPLYVGVDVGIKNLAFCVIDAEKWEKYRDKESDDPGIVAWENLNIVGEAEKCQSSLQSGKRKGDACGKNAKWMEGKTDKNYFCGTHKSQKCKKYTPPKMKNINMALLKKKAFIELDKFAIFDRVNYIVIETQRRINQKMKMFGASIESYFIIRQQIDNDAAALRTIKASSAKNKLKMYDGPYIAVGHIKDPYDRRKYLAQKHTEHFLQRSPEILEKWYFPNKKKDDLADAFLHCIWAILKR